MRDYRGPDWDSHFAQVEPWLAGLPQLQPAAQGLAGTFDPAGRTYSPTVTLG
jgi:hypothetical protein